MIKSKMDFSELEKVYDLLAGGIDKAGEGKATLFLSKVALGLASQMKNSTQVKDIVDTSLNDL